MTRVKKILFFTLITLAATLAVTNCKKASCEEPCAKMVECPAKITGQTLTTQEMELLKQGCDNSCKKHSELMWKCYEQSKNSANFCEEMFRCADTRLDK